MFELFQVLATSLAGARRVLLARLQGVSAEERAEGCEVLHPHGFVSRPSITQTLYAVALRVGDDVLAFALRDKGAAAFSPTVEEGETRVYAPNGATIRIRANGDIELNPAAGQNVYVGGTSGAVPIALGDTVASHLAALQSWADAHTHTATWTGSPGSGPTSPPLGSSPAPPDVQADHAFVKPT